MIYNLVFKFILLSYIVWDMLIVALRNIQIGVQRSRKLPFWGMQRAVFITWKN